ncbi:MAG TPA: hypothetical protein VNE39_21665 [Planctomycetota bacterium]|nr:hypothetical protein [Planctomycetota bacterium]
MSRRAMPCFGLLLLLMSPLASAASAPENLARKAKAAASSEYNAQYAAQRACDGEIPSPISKADVGKAWVAKGNDHPKGVTFTLEWPEPVTVAEVVYYGRTGWVWGENWRDYELYLDGASAKPAVKGTLKAGHGGQRIKLPAPTRLQRLTLKFLNSYGGPNPGASEIQAYAESLPDVALGKFVAPTSLEDTFAPPPPIEDSPALVAKLKAGGLGFAKLLVVQRHHINCTHVYTYHCEGQRDGGGIFLADLADGSLKQLLDSSQGQILGCDLSYDAEAILFSWRKKGSPYYQLYTIGVDGSGLTQLTQGDYYNYDGAWLPDGRIVFLSTRISQAAYCFFTPVGILYTMNADGSDQRRISANYLNDFTPAVTNDGRIIYGRWEYVDRPAIPIQSLWTINPDGTMLQGFFGNRVLDPASFIEPQAIPGSTAILCTLTGHNGSCRGAIGIVHPANGDNSQGSIRNVTPEIRLRGVAVSSNGPRGPYQTPYPVDGTHFLVSHDGTILLRDYEGKEQAVVLKPTKLGFYNPRPLRSRARPPVRSPYAAPESTEQWATVFVQDIYNGLAPHVERGEVKQIAVVQELRRTLISSAGIHRPAFDFQRVLISCGATYVPKKVWGFADVAPDGSACFKVPAQLPLYFIALDAQGRAVQRMRSHTALMPGEVQGCIGCHEQRHEPPQRDRLLPVLARPPQDLVSPEWGARGFDYASIVQPVLDKHCIKCHNPVGGTSASRVPPKGIDLTGDRTDYFNMSYECLARKDQGRTGSPYVNWTPSYNGHEWNILEITPKKWGSHASKLAEIVLASHPDADGKPRVQLDEPSRRRIFMWIDLNVPYYATADTALPELPACRQLLPNDLRKAMDDVYARRCNDCHAAAKLRVATPWRGHKWGELGVRIEHPELNTFLLAPLARAAGGAERCGKPVFASKDDPDYQAVLKTFLPIHELMKQRPRMDMPGAKPASCCLVDDGGPCP